MANHIVCIGEALVDMVEIGEPGSQPTFLAAWGGSVLNVAVGARRLGSDVEFAGSLSIDSFGHQLLAFLQAEGVGTALTNTTETHTAIAITTIQGAEPRYTFYAQPASYGFLAPAIGARQQVASASVVHAGSLGVLEEMTFDAMVESFQGASGVKTFDPNVRPALVTDWAEYRSRLGQLIGLSDFVKFSAEDLEATYPGQGAERIAMATLEGRARAVLVTKADQPVSLYTEAEHTEIPLPTGFDVRDTTGGGDAVMAAMLHQIAHQGLPTRQEGWESMVTNSLVVSALACSRQGGAIAMPTAQEVEAAGLTL